MKSCLFPAAALAILLAGCTVPTEMPIASTPFPAPVVTAATTPAPVSAPTAESIPAPEELKELWGFPIDNTHDAFEVPTGRRLGTVLVTVEMDEEKLRSTVSVWDRSDRTAPIQTIETDGVTTRCRELLDANFDGHTDFCYTWYRGAKNDTCSLYTWDEEKGQFCFIKQFLGTLEVNEESRTLYNWTSGSMSSGTREEFQWENGELICLRKIAWTNPLEDDLQNIELVTYERVDGKLIEFSRKLYPIQE